MSDTKSQRNPYDLTGATVERHYWAVLHLYGTGVEKYDHRDAIIAAMEYSKATAANYDLENEHDRAIAETACVVTIEERAYFTYPEGGGVDRGIHRETYSWLRDHNRTQYYGIISRLNKEIPVGAQA